MTTEPVELAALLAARERMAQELQGGLDADERRFLLSLVAGRPEWPLLGCACRTPARDSLEAHTTSRNWNARARGNSPSRPKHLRSGWGNRCLPLKTEHGSTRYGSTCRQSLA